MNTGLNAEHGAVADMRGQVVQDLKGLVADSESLLKEVLNASSEEFTAVRARIDDRLGVAAAVGLIIGTMLRSR